MEIRMRNFRVAIIESCVTLGEFDFKVFQFIFSNKIFHLLRLKPPSNFNNLD